MSTKAADKARRNEFIRTISLLRKSLGSYDLVMVALQMKQAWMHQCIEMLRDLSDEKQEELKDHVDAMRSHELFI